MIGNIFGNMFNKKEKTKTKYNQKSSANSSSRHDSANDTHNYSHYEGEQKKQQKTDIRSTYENNQAYDEELKQVKTPNRIKQNKNQQQIIKSKINKINDDLERHYSCPDTQLHFGYESSNQKLSKVEEITNNKNDSKSKQYIKQQSLRPNKSKEDEEFKDNVKLSKEEIKKRRRLQRDKKDAKVRREWGSQSGELLVINEEYVPEPEPIPEMQTNHSSQDEESNSKKHSNRAGKKLRSGISPKNLMSGMIGLRSNDFMRKCSDTSSTSDSDINSQDDKPTGYEKIMRKLEKKKGKISKEDFNIISLIGTGSYGKVFLVRKIDTQKIYAMKVLTKSFVRKYKQVKHTWTERKVLEKIIHPFIVKLKYAFQSPKKLFLVMEYCAGGELFFYLSKIGRFKQRSAQFYDGYAKITDFGLSKDDMPIGRQTKSICGTTEYLSPEMLLGKGYDQSCDWWGFGCLVYEMLVGLPPFYFKSQDELFYAILNLQPQYPDYLSKEAVSLITQLLEKNPVSRLRNVKSIKSHPFFAEIDWKKMKEKKIKPPYTPNLKCEDDITHFDTNDIDLTINTPGDMLNDTQDKNGNQIGNEDFNNHDFDGFTFDGNNTIISACLDDQK
eukprot:403357021